MVCYWMSVNFRKLIILCFSVVGKGQILLDAQCHTGVTAGAQVKVTLTRHESAVVGAGIRDSCVVLILILSELKFRGGKSKSNTFAESASRHHSCIHLHPHAKIKDNKFGIHISQAGNESCISLLMY